MTIQDDHALVLFSVGQDSTTCLAWARDRYAHVETLGFDYSQRHRIELDVRPKVLAALRERLPRLAAKLGEDHVIDLSVLGQISDTALTRETEIAMQQSGLPNTFVPGRNLVFLSVAGARTYRRGARHIGGCRCQSTFSRYPTFR